MPADILPRTGLKNPSIGQDPYGVDMRFTLQRLDDVSTWKVPSGSSESVAQAALAAALAASVSNGAGGGVVEFGTGVFNLSAATSLLVTMPNISIRGAGSAATFLNYTGSGDCIKVQPSPSTVQQPGAISGLTIFGSSMPNARGIHFVDTGVAPWLDDVVIQGFTGTDGVGLLMENVAVWNERAGGVGVHLNGNKFGMRLTAPSGFVSFSYHRWLDLRINVGAGQTGIESLGYAQVQQGTWNIMCNGAGGRLLHVGDHSNWATPGFAVFSESLTNGAVVDSTAVFNPSGFWNPDAPDSGYFSTGFLYNSLGQMFATSHLPNTLALAAGAGTGAAVVNNRGNPTRGDIAFTAGTGPAAGKLLSVTYSYPYPNRHPISLATPVISPLGRASAHLGLAIGPVGHSNTGFDVECDVAPTAGVAYGFTYHVIG